MFTGDWKCVQIGVSCDICKKEFNVRLRENVLTKKPEWERCAVEVSVDLYVDQTPPMYYHHVCKNCREQMFLAFMDCWIKLKGGVENIKRGDLDLDKKYQALLQRRRPAVILEKVSQD